MLTHQTYQYFCPEILSTIVDHDEVMILKLLDHFLDQIDGARADLVQALHAQDIDKVERASHFLKGSVAMVSEGALVSTLSQVERSARDGTVDAGEDMAEQIRTALCDLEGEVRRYIAQARTKTAVPARRIQ